MLFILWICFGAGQIDNVMSMHLICLFLFRMLDLNLMFVVFCRFVSQYKILVLHLYSHLGALPVACDWLVFISSTKVTGRISASGISFYILN